MYIKTCGKESILNQVSPPASKRFFIDVVEKCQKHEKKSAEHGKA